MIAGADHEPGLGAEAVEIFAHHDALRAPIDQRGEVEVIARHHHHVEVSSNIEDPIELRQRIMQVGYQEEAHGPKCLGGREACRCRITIAHPWPCQFLWRLVGHQSVRCFQVCQRLPADFG